MSVRYTSHIPQILAAERAAKTRAHLAMADEVLKVAQRKVPVRTGKLRDSGIAEADDHRGQVAYTDSKAVAAHENMQDRLRNGREPKYLERAVTESAGRLSRVVARAMRFG